MTGCAELPVLTGSGQFPQHILVQIPLHIQVGNIVLIQVVQACNDFLQHLGCGNQEHGITHVPGESSIFFRIILGVIYDFDHLALFREIGQMAMLHVFNSREHPLGNDIINLTRIVILELAPAHRLSDRGLGEDFIHLLAAHVLKFFCFQFFFIKRTNEHQVGQLFNYCQRISNAASPDVRPDFIYFIFDCACNHASFPPFSLSGTNSITSPILQFNILQIFSMLSIETGAPFPRRARTFVLMFARCIISVLLKS